MHLNQGRTGETALFSKPNGLFYKPSINHQIFHKMEDRKLTEKESLEVITSMIALTKQRYIGDGRILLLFGYLTVAVSALIWILLVITQNPVWNWLWFLVWIIGGIVAPIKAKKQQIEKGVKIIPTHSHPAFGLQSASVQSPPQPSASHFCLSKELTHGL